MKYTFKESLISLNDIHKNTLPQKPPRSLKKTEVIFELNALFNATPHPITFQKKFLNILHYHTDNLYVFTDDSKDNDKTAVLNKTIIKKTLPTKCSIFTAEARATDLAFNIISKSKLKKHIVFTDSLLVLVSLSNKKKLVNPLITKLLSRLDSMFNRNEIIIC